jgi:hypothetical protein
LTSDDSDPMHASCLKSQRWFVQNVNSSIHEPVAVKHAKSGVHDLDDLQREVSVLQLCSLPHVLPLLGCDSHVRPIACSHVLPARRPQRRRDARLAIRLIFQRAVGSQRHVQLRSRSAAALDERDADHGARAGRGGNAARTGECRRSAAHSSRLPHRSVPWRDDFGSQSEQWTQRCRHVHVLDHRALTPPSMLRSVRSL